MAFASYRKQLKRGKKILTTAARRRYKNRILTMEKRAKKLRAFLQRDLEKRRA